MKSNQISNILYNNKLSIGENRSFALFAEKTLKPKDIANLSQMNRENPNAYVELVRKVLAEGMNEEMKTYNEYIDPTILDEMMHSKGGARTKRRRTKRRTKTKCRRTRRSKK